MYSEFITIAAPCDSTQNWLSYPNVVGTHYTIEVSSLYQGAAPRDAAASSYTGWRTETTTGSQWVLVDIKALRSIAGMTLLRPANTDLEYVTAFTVSLGFGRFSYW